MVEVERVYLDFAATTPLNKQVLASMLPYFSEDFGNPSSVHRWGQNSEAVVETARESLSKLLHTETHRVVFTSGGTESDNLAIRGGAHHARNTRKANQILISPVEHPAVAQTAVTLCDEGFEIEWLPVDRFGMVDPDDVRSRITKNTALVSVIFGQNEIGTINPVEEIARECNEREVFFHSDGVQALAHLEIDLTRNHVHSFAMGAHKLYGPKGVGALILADNARLDHVQTGGGQESGMRAGTHNVPGIVGLAKAYEITRQELNENASRMITLRDKIIEGVTTSIENVTLTGHPQQRLPNHASFVFEKVDGNTLLMLLDAGGFGCSSGSACKSGNPKPSEVLLAIGVNPKSALGSLRVTLGRETTLDEIERFLAFLPKVVEQARKLYVE